MQFTDNTKKIASSIAGVAFAIAIGIQTFVFGKNDLENLTQKVEQLSQRIKILEKQSH